MHDRLDEESPGPRPEWRAVLDALAEFGYEGLTVEAIARRAGPSAAALGAAPEVEELVATAIAQLELFAAPPPTGTLRGDLRALLNPWRTPRTTDERAVAAVLSAAEWHPPLKAAVAQALDRPLNRAMATVLTRAAEHAVPQAALQTLNWLLHGLVLERFRAGSRSAVDIDALVDFLLAGVEQQVSAARRSADATA